MVIVTAVLRIITYPLAYTNTIRGLKCKQEPYLAILENSNLVARLVEMALRKRQKQNSWLQLVWDLVSPVPRTVFFVPKSPVRPQRGKGRKEGATWRMGKCKNLSPLSIVRQTSSIANVCTVAQCFFNFIIELGLLCSDHTLNPRLTYRVALTHLGCVYRTS